MAPLDGLYGAGAAAAFAGASSLATIAPGSTLTVREGATPADGSVHVELVWRTAAGVPFAGCAIDCHRRRIQYTTLEVIPQAQGHGVYKALILDQLPLYHGWGVEAVTACPSTPHSEYVLALGGFQWQEYEGVRYFAALLAPGSRMAQYRTWLKEGAKPATEPAWHRELREAPVEPNAEDPYE